MMYIKVFGERNTATNAISKMIEKNSDSKCAPSTAIELDRYIDIKKRIARVVSRKCEERVVDNVFDNVPPPYSWKHAATNFNIVSDFEPYHVIFTVRHPASWVLSLYKNPYHLETNSHQTLAQFIQKKYRTVGRERLNKEKFRPLSLLEEKIKSYDVFASKLADSGFSFSFVRFEDFVLNQEAVFNGLSEFILYPSSEFRILVESTKTKKKT